MRTERKGEHTAAQPRPSSFVSLLSGWVQQAMESFFATQRILVDVAMRQNANTMKAMREGLSDPEHSPASLLTELAVEGTASFVEAQRILLDLAQEENELLMNGVSERMSGSNTGVAMANVVRRSVENFVAMQQEFLTIASKQSQNWLHDMKTGKPFDRTCLMDLAKEGMENFVKTQKKLLDVIGEETARATTGKPERMPKQKRTELATLARESSDALIDAQKKLLDVAAHQMNSNLDMAKRARNVTMPFRLPLAKITGDGVKSFIDAEKALIDSMVKQPQPHAAHKQPQPHSGGRGRAKRTRRAHKRPMAKAAVA